MVRVLVVGAGIAGLAAALAAARAGASVDVAGPTGNALGQVHVNVPPNMLRDLAWLGVARDCVRKGFPYLDVGFVAQQGHERFREPTPRMAGAGYPAAVAMTHAALTTALRDAAQRAGAAIGVAAHCRRFEEAGDALLAHFDDGAVRPYDVLIGADGARSRLRETLFGKACAPCSTGQEWWQVSLRRPRGLDRPTLMLGAFDRGRAGAVPVSDAAASLFMIQPEADARVVPAVLRAEFMRSRLTQCGGVIAELRDQLAGSECVLVRPVRAGLLHEPWHRGRVLLVGDAAHVIAPQLGQAAAQCIEDAVALGLLLREAPDHEALFAEFMRRRYERCRITHDTSLQVARWELQPDSSTDIPAAARAQAQAVAGTLFGGDPAEGEDNRRFESRDIAVNTCQT